MVGVVSVEVALSQWDGQMNWMLRVVAGIPRGVVWKIDTLPDTDAPPSNTQNLRNENFKGEPGYEDARNSN